MHHGAIGYFLCAVRQNLSQISVDSRYDADYQASGLHDLLTLILWTSGCGDT
jgi:hypothetical protein